MQFTRPSSHTATHRVGQPTYQPRAACLCSSRHQSATFECRSADDAFPRRLVKKRKLIQASAEPTSATITHPPRASPPPAPRSANGVIRSGARPSPKQPANRAKEVELLQVAQEERPRERHKHQQRRLVDPLLHLHRHGLAADRLHREKGQLPAVQRRQRQRVHHRQVERNDRAKGEERHRVIPRQLRANRHDANRPRQVAARFAKVAKDGRQAANGLLDEARKLRIDNAERARRRRPHARHARVGRQLHAHRGRPVGRTTRRLHRHRLDGRVRLHHRRRGARRAHVARPTEDFERQRPPARRADGRRDGVGRVHRHRHVPAVNAEDDVARADARPRARADRVGERRHNDPRVEVKDGHPRGRHRQQHRRVRKHHVGRDARREDQRAVEQRPVLEEVRVGRRRLLPRLLVNGRRFRKRNVPAEREGAQRKLRLRPRGRVREERRPKADGKVLDADPLRARRRKVPRLVHDNDKGEDGEARDAACQGRDRVAHRRRKGGRRRVERRGERRQRRQRGQQRRGGGGGGREAPRRGRGAARRPATAGSSVRGRRRQGVGRGARKPRGAAAANAPGAPVRAAARRTPPNGGAKAGVMARALAPPRYIRGVQRLEERERGGGSSRVTEG
ncbi:hypothetical protein BU14_0268s0008 [Porphyra umbilicalis]|uniref:Uncharacterized protein n=1 Tax=Porphyra umbilicalis TaxID=2786 RepID=A0A1X6P1S7_PORUM|nr:hypothetical protein BU14_0268s0008 [Porphyra umbilicalis]|eukprot:OSX74767.1 hypothetical protein BU14_0268s0008 [Porphyra umbilicalis]